MPGDDSAAVMDAVFAAIDGHDLATLQQHPGLQETVQHIPMMWTALPDMRHVIEKQIVAGEMVATAAVVHGTHRGPLLGIPPTGKALSFLLLTLDHIVEGKVVLHYGVPDWFSLLRELGALPGAVQQSTPGPHA